MKFILKYIFLISLFLFSSNLFAQKILIPMDLSQTNHLKAYGITYWILKNGGTVDWLLNYRGGSFMLENNDKFVAECRIRGVSFEMLGDGDVTSIYKEVQSDEKNMDVVKLEKVPKIAVYVTPGNQPWDDAVRLALEYAEVDYETVWDEEVLTGKLKDYDWIHLHHEDFTGQYGKFWNTFNSAPWYIEQVARNEAMARKLGYSKVSQMKLAVAQKLREYVVNGGFLFAMCSATDSYDVALAAHNVDICGSMYDGDSFDPDANSKLDFSQTIAFENFQLVLNPLEYEFSNIDVGSIPTDNPETDYFTLFDFSAKFDPVPTMLTQCHVNLVKGFKGQTTAFNKDLIKKSITILAEREGTKEVRYIHTNLGRGTITWYSGHDPEDYMHAVNDPKTDLSLHKKSPGYRLILNNVLFPAAKKKKQKT